MFNISPKIAGVCGIFIPIVVFTCIGLSISWSPWFRWTENWLSDLGGFIGEKPVWAAHGAASVIFNIGLITTGVMGIVFATVIKKIPRLDTYLGRLGIKIFFLDACALCTMGIFPQTIGDLHILASIIFWVLIPPFLLFIGIVLKKSSEKILGWFGIVLGVISFCTLPMFFIPRPWGYNAIVEIILSVSASTFVMFFGIRLLQGKFK